MKVQWISMAAGAVLAMSFSAPAQAILPLNVPGTDLFEHPFGSLFDTRTAKGLEPDGIAFNNALYEGYWELSDDRGNAWTHADWDFVDAELFNHKALDAANNSSVVPDAPMDRELTDEQAAMFQRALERLELGFTRGGRYLAPGAAATAQVKYDCWIEATEDGRTEDADACKAAFEDAMREVESVANWELTELDMMAAAAPELARYLVYFEFDSTQITEEGRPALEAAIRDARANSELAIELIGHADRSGGDAYNQRLSQRRAERITQELTRAGIERSRIRAAAVGESNPLVETPDGVRERANRVVEIDLL